MDVLDGGVNHDQPPGHSSPTATSAGDPQRPLPTSAGDGQGSRVGPGSTAVNDQRPPSAARGSGTTQGPNYKPAMKSPPAKQSGSDPLHSGADLRPGGQYGDSNSNSNAPSGGQSQPGLLPSSAQPNGYLGAMTPVTSVTPRSGAGQGSAKPIPAGDGASPGAPGSSRPPPVPQGGEGHLRQGPQRESTHPSSNSSTQQPQQKDQLPTISPDQLSHTPSSAAEAPTANDNTTNRGSLPNTNTTPRTLLMSDPPRESNMSSSPAQAYVTQEHPTLEENHQEEDALNLKPPLEGEEASFTTSPAPPTEYTYGWGSCRPQCLQFLNKPVWVVTFLCAAIVAESMATIGLVSISVSTLETRFQLSSNQAGLIPSAYEFAGLPALIISGYFGGNGHRPRWIAGGMFLLSLGSLLFALPHFVTAPYEPHQGAAHEGSDVTCSANQSVVAFSPCVAGESGGVGPPEDLSHYLYVFMAGHMLHGIGGVPLYTLSLTYIDDIATRGTASVYIGVILSLTTLGPAIAFVGAGYLLELYTDIDVVDVSTVSLTSSDPRWVGAWWIGFLVTFTLALCTVIPLAGFPRDMPGAAERRKTRVTEVHDAGDDVDLPGMHPGVGLKARDFPRAVRVLVKNPTFMFLTLVGAFELFFLAGFGTFEPKYMEKMFHVSPATAGTITGLLGVPGGAAGSILASVLIKRLKMTSTQMLKWMFLLTVIIIFLNVIFLVQCDDVPFAGVNVPYANSTDVITLADTCNQQCACSEFSYAPVCGSNNVFYFSPCHAGCDIANATSGHYESCACIPPVVGEVPSFAQSELCTSPCHLLPLYSVLFFFGIMLAYLTGMFHLLAVIRVVPESQRSFAVSIDWFLSRLLGGILGPVAFGSMLDLTCVLWEKKCEGSGSGSCLYYENKRMGWYIFCMATVCLTACLFSSFMAWWKYKPPSRPSPTDTTPSLTEEKPATIEMNGTV